MTGLNQPAEPVVANVDDLYLDHVQLRARGWTRTMVERFLVRPDRWETVNHWQNYKGKATYFVERVMQQEALQTFRAAFERSTRRRRLTEAELECIALERSRVDGMYRQWLKTVSAQDVRNMLAAQELAAVFEQARARGYRTPHK